MLGRVDRIDRLFGPALDIDASGLRGEQRKNKRRPLNRVEARKITRAMTQPAKHRDQALAMSVLDQVKCIVKLAQHDVEIPTYGDMEIWRSQRTRHCALVGQPVTASYDELRHRAAT